MESALSHPEIVVDLEAIRDNVRFLREVAAPAALMVVVKADGYGHGLVPVARAAREAGADWLGVATVDEGLALREAGVEGPLLCWLDAPGPYPARAVAADLDLTAYTGDELDRIAEAGRQRGRPARAQLKVDTGLSRGGSPASDWPRLVERARSHQEAGWIEVTGIWSHLACADEPDHPANAAQRAAFSEAVAVAAQAGLDTGLRHLANSAGTLLHPDARWDLVRCGIAAYGLDPAPGRTPAALAGRLRPAMSVRAGLTLSRPLTAGAGVSYGHAWTAAEDTTVGLVPLGYGDGVLRHASDTAQVQVAGRRRPIRGRVCMDQFVVDLGGALPSPGEPVLLFGPGTDGEPTAQDWAEACGTISYEIVTRIGGRATRRYVDGSAAPGGREAAAVGQARA